MAFMTDGAGDLSEMRLVWIPIREVLWSAPFYKEFYGAVTEKAPLVLHRITYFRERLAMARGAGDLVAGVQTVRVARAGPRLEDPFQGGHVLARGLSVGDLLAGKPKTPAGRPRVAGRALQRRHLVQVSLVKFGGKRVWLRLARFFRLVTGQAGAKGCHFDFRVALAKKIGGALMAGGAKS
jgi:hypothetical protein